MQLGNSPRRINAVRFAFWGAENSADWVTKLRQVASARFQGIALYLNFDMLVARVPGYHLRR